MGQARPWCCLLKFNQSRVWHGVSKCWGLWQATNDSCQRTLRNTPWALIYTLKQNEGSQLSRGSKESTIQPLKWLLQLQPLLSFPLGWWISGFQVTAPSFLWLSRRSWHPQPTPLNSTEPSGGARADSVVLVGGCSAQLGRASQHLCSCAWGPSGHHGSMLPRVRSMGSYPRGNCQLRCPSYRFTGSLQGDWTQAPTEGNCSSVRTWLSFLPSLSHASPLFTSASWDHLPLN